MLQTFRPPGSRSSQQLKREHNRWRCYGLAIWRSIRAAQLTDEPLCRMCGEDGKLTPATSCDHIEPHRDDWDRLVRGPFQSLCSRCHNKHKQRIEASTLEE